MAARLVQVTLVNNSDHPIAWLDDQRPHGFWQEPWYPSNIKNLTKGQSASWRLESGGVATGVEGRAWFKVDIGHGQTEFLDFWWERPYIGKFDRTATCTRHDPRTNDPDHIGPFVVYAKDLGFSGSNDDQSPFEFLLGIPTIPVVGNVPSTIILLNNDTNATQVAWVVEVLNVGESSKLRLQAAVQGVIYAIMDNGDLLWYRHDGRGDGSFTWASNEGKKVGNGWNAKQVFSG